MARATQFLYASSDFKPASVLYQQVEATRAPSNGLGTPQLLSAAFCTPQSAEKLCCRLKSIKISGI